jgi:3-oxoacyl-(acyl-carrier-protein) synthase
VVWISVAHRIAADELTAVGTDTFLTGGTIHDASRAAVIAGDGDVVWLARDRYTRTLAPAAAEHIGLLVSLEDAGESAVRICVRAIDRNGTAVACGFQTVSCFTRTGDEAPLPPLIRERLAAHAEPSESFAARAVSGGSAVAALFTDDVLAAGARIVAPETLAPRPTVRSSVIFRATSSFRPSVVRKNDLGAGAPRRSGLFGAVPEFNGPIIADRGGIAFVFPGVDGYDGQLLRELHAALPYLSSYIDEADAVARRELRTSFFPLVDAETLADHDAHLRRCPELAHLGAFVSGVLFAEALHERGIRPDVLVGHGSGEITALAVAGAFDGRTGLEIIAQRVGAFDDLADSTAAAFPASLTEQLERGFAKLKLRAPRAQLYSPVARRMLGPDVQLPKFLATHTLLQSDFSAAVHTLRDAGCEYFVECGAGGLTRSLDARRSGAAPTERKSLREKLDAASKVLAKRAAVTKPQHPAPARVAERAPVCPVAITGIGCVLPGARDVDAYWRNVLEGDSAIRERETLETEAWDGVSASGEPKASAIVGDVEHQPHLPFSFDEFSALSAAQRMLALALEECLPGIRDVPRAEKPRVRCILGASAEGMREFEESSLVDQVRAKIATLDVSSDLRNAIAAGFVDMAGTGANANTAGACATLGSVVERCLGGPADTMLVDAACASSLYALDLGMKSLQASECDVAIVGGIFTPGASWHPLYAQLEGLLGSDAAPFTRAADGVVFGEGVALLALERLSDAVDGDRVRAVVRGVGLSCDGRKASVADANAAGQSLAIQRAYDTGGVAAATIQFVEGHGVSDPTVDAAEIESLHTIFDGHASRPLASVKALIGHTVWASGGASIAKVCRALEEATIPPQPPVNDDVSLVDGAAGLETPTSARPWPANIGNEPRRAGVSAFGLGGTNAHAVIEAASDAYHRALAESTPAGLPRIAVALVGFTELTAADTQTLMPMLRADVVEHLDATQRLASAAADKALGALAGWADHREHIGVVAAVVGRTARATAATQRVYRDELRRILATNASSLGVTSTEAEHVAQSLHDAIGADTTPITPHTLIGMLPNIAAARVGNVFDLRGPNLAIDAGARSVLEALGAAERWLAGGATDVMLVCLSRPDGNEGMLVASLTAPAFARARGWPVLGELAFGERGKDTLVVRPQRATRTRVELKIRASRALAGLDELAHAVAGASSGRATIMRWERDERGAVSPLGRLVTPVSLELATTLRPS